MTLSDVLFPFSMQAKHQLSREQTEHLSSHLGHLPPLQARWGELCVICACVVCCTFVVCTCYLILLVYLLLFMLLFVLLVHIYRSIVSPERVPSRVSPTDTSDKDLTTSLDQQPSHIRVTKVTSDIHAYLPVRVVCE